MSIYVYRSCSNMTQDLCIYFSNPGISILPSYVRSRKKVCIFSSQSDRLYVPSGWTPLRWNSTTASVWLRVPYPLWAFVLLRLLFCLCLVPHSLASFSFPTFFNSLYFPFSPAFPLPKSCWACPLQVLPPAYFLLHPSTLSSHVLSFPPAFPYPVLSFVPVLPMFVPHFPFQNPEGELQVPPSASFLPFSFTLPFRTSLYCGFYLYCVCIAFSSHFLLAFSWKNIFVIDDFFYWFGSCLSNVITFALNLMHQLRLFAFLS